MLADQRRPRDVARRLGEFHPEAGRHDLAAHWMGQAQEHLARRDLRMIEHLLDSQDRTGGDARAVEAVNPVRRGI